MIFDEILQKHHNKWCIVWFQTPLYLELKDDSATLVECLTAKISYKNGDCLSITTPADDKIYIRVDEIKAVCKSKSQSHYSHMLKQARMRVKMQREGTENKVVSIS